MKKTLALFIAIVALPLAARAESPRCPPTEEMFMTLGTIYNSDFQEITGHNPDDTVNGVQCLVRAFSAGPIYAIGYLGTTFIGYWAIWMILAVAAGALLIFFRI